MHRGALILKRLHVSHWRSLVAATVIRTVAVLSQADGQPTQRKPNIGKNSEGHRHRILPGPGRWPA
jgi:hypothetical protein